MKDLDALREEIPDALLIDGADAALIGTVERCGQPTLLCYDYAKLVRVFRRQGMSEEEAVEYIDFNVAGAWMGVHTPAILYRF